MFNDLMENIEWFFNLHDKNKDGYLTKDEVLTLSESLLVSKWEYCYLATVTDPSGLVHLPPRDRGCIPRSRQSVYVKCVRVRRRTSSSARGRRSQFRAATDRVKPAVHEPCNVSA